MSLVVSPKDINGFDSDVTDYVVGMAATVTQATITATPYRTDDTVTINGTTVTNGSAHTVDLDAGLNTFTIVVNSSGTADSTTYTVYIGRGTTGPGRVESRRRPRHPALRRQHKSHGRLV